MKKKLFFMAGMLAMVLVFGMTVLGCASGPVLGSPTPLQIILNAMPAIPIPTVGSLKFQFGGDTWIATLSGANFMAGTFTSEETDDGSILTLQQTHIAGSAAPGAAGMVAKAAGWVKMTGKPIVLEYIKGPPASLSRVKTAEDEE